MTVVRETNKSIQKFKKNAFAIIHCLLRIILNVECLLVDIYGI